MYCNIFINHSRNSVNLCFNAAQYYKIMRYHNQLDIFYALETSYYQYVQVNLKIFVSANYVLKITPNIDWICFTYTILSRAVNQWHEYIYCVDQTTVECLKFWMTMSWVLFIFIKKSDSTLHSSSSPGKSRSLLIQPTFYFRMSNPKSVLWKFSWTFAFANSATLTPGGSLTETTKSNVFSQELEKFSTGEKSGNSKTSWTVLEELKTSFLKISN